MRLIKKTVPELVSITLVSDNGPNISCPDNMSYILCRNKMNWMEEPCGVNNDSQQTNPTTDSQQTLKVSRYIFFEAQQG